MPALTTQKRLGSVDLVLLAAAALIAAAGCRAQQAATGLTDVGHPHANGFRVHVLDNKGFTVGYAPKRHSAVWVVYRASEVPWRGDFERPKYHADPRVADPVPWYAYSHTGYDRGHLAPNYIISRLYGHKAQKQTFLMTNIVPQRPRLNELVWQRLEEIEADHLAPSLQALRVTTGPIFGNDPERIKNGPASRSRSTVYGWTACRMASCAPWLLSSRKACVAMNGWINSL